MTKKVGVLVASLIIGAILTYIIVRLIPTTPEIFGLEYFILLTLFLAGIFVIWIDHFTNAGILPR